MSKSSPREPLFLRVSKRTPVTVHIRPTTTKSAAKKGGVGRVRSSSSEVGRRLSGRPVASTSNVSTAQPSRSRSGLVSANQSARSLTSKGKPSSQSLRPKMSWEGSTHRLEIHPPRHLHGEGNVGKGEAGRREGEQEGEEEEHTMLRMSDLEGHEGRDEAKKAAENDFEERIQSLQNEVDALTAKFEEEQLPHTVPLTRSRLLHNTLINPSEPRERVLGNTASLTSSRLQEQTRKREELVSRLEEVEKESVAISKHMDQLQDSIKKIAAGKRVPSQLGVQRSKLLKKMTEFKQGSRSLRKLLKEQQSQESCAATLDPTQSTAGPQLDPNIALHTQGLHDEIERKEVELQSLMMHAQSLEEHLQKRDQDYNELQTSLYECKRKAQEEKEALKRAARQHKHRATHSKHTAEQLGQQLEEASCELEEARGKLAELASEKTRQQTELSTLSTRVKELDNCLMQSKTTSESAVEAVSTRLTEKTRELNTAQLENDHLRTTLNTIEGALKSMEMNSATKISNLEAELAQTRATCSQYETLSEEYKNQLERCRRECEDAQRDARRKDLEMDRHQQDHTAEMEKFQKMYDRQLAELEPLPELLKVSELRLQEAQQRLAMCEQRAAEQSRLVDELTTKYDRQSGSLEEMRQKWHEVVAENKSLISRLDSVHKRVQEADTQNRELVAIAGKKEEAMQKLQSRLEETQVTVSSLQAELHSTNSESRRQQEHIRDKAAGKERAHAARIADLESQITKCNNLNSQLRRNKEEAERLHQSQLRSLQEQLDGANASRRSIETYVNFLKASYSSLYSETGKHSSPPFHV